MKKTRALVWSPTGSPLAKFLRILHRRFYELGTSVAENAAWSELPLETMLADGLWPVLLKAGEKLNQPVTTQNSALAMTTRINRLVNAGLVLGYATIEEAAGAFEDQVIKTVRARLEDPPESPSNLWQEPVAQFIAHLVRLAAEAGRRIEKLMGVCETENRFSEESRISYLHRDSRYYKDLPDSLRLESDGRMPFGWDFVGGAEAELLCELRLIRLLQRLPISREQVEAAQTMDSDLEAAWFNTQAIKALTQGPNRDYVTLKEYLRALKKRRSVSDETLYERFMCRLAKRPLPAFTDEERSAISTWARRAVEQTRRMCSTIDISTTRDVLLRVTEREQAAAMRTTKMTDPTRKIAWKSVTAQDLEDHVRHNVPQNQIRPFTAELANNLWKIPENEQAGALEYFHLLLPDGEKERLPFLEKLFSSPLLSQRPELLEPQLPVMRHKYLYPWLAAFLVRYTQMGALDVDSTWLEKTMKRLNTKERRAIVFAKETRQALAEIGVKSSLPGRIPRQKSDNAYLELLQLAHFIWKREAIFLDPKATERLSSWDHLEDDAEVQEASSKEFAKVVAAWARKHTEDDVFRWLYEGGKDFNKRYRAFVRGRAAHFKRQK